MHTAGLTHIATHRVPTHLIHTPTCAGAVLTDAEFMVSLVKTHVLIRIWTVPFVKCEKRMEMIMNEGFLQLMFRT